MRSRLLIISLLYSFFIFGQSLTITSPTEGEEFHPFRDTVDITIDVQGFNVANGTGDGHIHWTIQENAETPEEQDMKYNTNTEAIDVFDGSSYTVYMEQVDNSDVPINPAVNATVNFSIASLTEINGDFTEIRADVVANGAGKYYLTNTISAYRVTYRDDSTNRIWIQDGDDASIGEISGIVIHDPLGAIQYPYNVNDVLLISELSVQSEIVNGVIRLIPYFENSFSPVNEPVPTQIVTITDFKNNYEDYESELIELQNVTFDDGNGVLTFSAGNDYGVTDATMNTVIKRTDFANANYIGELIPSSQLSSLIAIGGENDGTPEIYVRNLLDMTLETEDYEFASNLVVYPNPASNGEFTINSSNQSEKSIEIYTLLGQRIYKNLVLNNELINVSYLNSGVYILKINEGAKITSLKLIIN